MSARCPFPFRVFVNVYHNGVGGACIMKYAHCLSDARTKAVKMCHEQIAWNKWNYEPGKVTVEVVDRNERMVFCYPELFSFDWRKEGF